LAQASISQLAVHEKMYSKTLVRLMVMLASVCIGQVGQAADRGMTDWEIWQACWAGEPSDSRRSIYYPPPISVTIRNRSIESWEICVYDNLCPYTLFKGRLDPKHSITLTACVDKKSRGSISLMNSEGDIWLYDEIRNRVITLQ
jgi:hypothetical protein